MEDEKKLTAQVGQLHPAVFGRSFLFRKGQTVCGVLENKTFADTDAGKRNLSFPVIGILHLLLSLPVRFRQAGFVNIPFRANFIFLIFILSAGHIFGQVTQTISASGPFIVPAGVTSITVKCWGAGGGGSTVTNSSRRGGGGGGGAYASSTISVIPGSVYPVVVGTGGPGNLAGGASSFNTTSVVAAGGNGANANSTTGGGGGTVIASTGTIKYAGGNGANGDVTSNFSGGGGGGAGSTGAGGNAIGSTAGAGATLWGGSGGAGVSASSNGNGGSVYGGGGSGAVTNSGNDRIGGSGAQGQVIISWTCATATISYTGTPFCKTLSTAQPVTLTGTGTYSGGTYSSSPGLTLNAVSGAITPSTSTAGTYTVTYTIPAWGDCSAQTVTTSVTITALPVATFSYTGSPYCSNATNPSPTFSGGGTAGIFSSGPGLVFVSTSTGQVNLPASTAGTYTVINTIAAAGGCAQVTANQTIVITALPTAVISYPASPYCNSSAPASVSLTGTSGGIFTASPAGLTIDAATGTITPATSSAGTYTVTYTIAAANGCGAVTATTTVTITSLPAATFSYTGTPYCQDESNPFPTFSGSGVAGIFSSTPGLVFVSTTTGQVNLAASTAGTYTVTNTIAAAGGCAQVAAISTIVITALPAATILYAGTPFCKSTATPQPVTRTGTAGGTYTASPPGLTIDASTGAITPSTSTAGTYIVSYTLLAAGGCNSVTATTSVTVTSAPAALISYPGTPYCSNAGTVAVTLTGTTGGTFTALPAGLSINSVTGAVNSAASAAGSYTVTYKITAAGGCGNFTTSTPISISTLAVATFNYAGTPYCQNAADPLPVFTGGGSAGTFSAGTGLVFVSTATGQIDLSASIPGTYTVTNTFSASGPCGQVTATSPVTITVLPAATIAYPSTAYCADAGIIPVNHTGTSGGIYSSSPAGLSLNAANGEINTGLSTAGTYTVSYTLATSGGCGNVTATTNVTINSLPPAQTGPNKSICTGASAQIGVAAVPGNTYSWTSDPAGFTSTVANPMVTPPETTTYTLVVTNTATGCTNSNSVMVTANQLINVTVNPVTQNICSGNTTSISLSSNLTGTVFTWDAELVIPATATTGFGPGSGSSISQTLVNTSGIPEVVRYTITATSGGCSNSETTVDVTVNPSPTIPTITPGGSLTFCSGGNVLLTSSFAIGYQWLLNGVAIGGAVNQTFTALVSGSYTVRITGANGCSSVSAASLVTVNPLPAVPVITGGPTSFCSGGNVILTSSAASGNQWLLNGSAIAGATNPTYTATTAGSYTVRVTNGNGCSATSEVTIVTVNALPAVPSISPGGPTTFCAGGSVTLTSTSTTAYQWLLNGSAIAGATSPTYSATATGSYTVTVTNTSGCSATSLPVNVTVNALPPVPVITAGGPTTFCAGGNVILTSSSATGNQWRLNGTPIGGATNTTYTVTAGGSYSVTVTNASNCPATSLVTTVVVNALPSVPVISAGGPTTFCMGASVVLSSSAASGNQWNLNGSAVAGATNQTYTVSLAGSYTVTTTNGSNCSATSTATVVVVNPLPAVPTISPLNPPAFCAGGNVILTSSVSSSYQWLLNGTAISGATNRTYQATASGNYSVIITNGNGCQATSAATVVTVKPLPVGSASQQTICSGGTTSIILTSTIPGTTFTWTASIYQAPLTGTITGFSPCSSSCSPSITQLLTNTSSSITNPAINGVGSPGIVRYLVTPTANGCTGAPFAVDVTVNPAPPQFNISWYQFQNVNIITICDGADLGGGGQDDLDVVLGNGFTQPAAGYFSGFTVQWQYAFSPSGPWLPAAPSPLTMTTFYQLQLQVGPNPSIFTAIGDYYFRFVVTNSYGCSTSSDVAELHITSTLTIEAGGPDNVCQSANPTAFPLTGAMVGGNSVPLSGRGGKWTITSGGGTLSNSNFINNYVNPNALAAVTYTPPANYSGIVTLTLTSNDPDGTGSANPCNPITDTRIITISPLATVIPGSAINACQSASPQPVTLSGASVGGSATTGAWSITSPAGTGSLSNTGQTANPALVTYTPPANFTGTVTLTLTTNSAGLCSAVSATRIITFNPIPVCSITGSDNVCPGSTNTYSAPAGMDTYTWSVSAGTASIIGSGTGQTVSVKAPSGCDAYTLSLTVIKSGCSSVCSQAFNATDTQNPVITCTNTLPLVVVDANSGTTYINSGTGWDATATDNCSYTLTASLTGATTGSGLLTLNGVTLNEGTTTVTWTATDLCGHSVTCTFNVKVNAKGDLSITKTASTNPVVSGAVLIYTITVTNAGPAVSQNVEITDNPVAVLSPQYSLSLAGPWSAWTGTLNGPASLAVNGTYTLYIKGLAPCINISNTASVSSDNDNNLANNTATVATAVVDVEFPDITTCPLPYQLAGCSTSVISPLAYSETKVIITEAQFLAAGLVAWDNCGIVEYSYIDTKTGVNPIIVTRTFTVKDGSGKTADCSFTITITSSPPVISVQPANQTDCKGSSVVFGVTVTGGIAPFTYTWQRKLPADVSFTNIPADPEITYPTASTMEVFNIGSANNPDLTQYKVIITDACGNITSNAATLRVNDITGITPVTVNTQICEGGSASYTVTTSIVPLSYQWLKDGVPLANGSVYSGATSATLTITNATTSQSGSYQVQVTFSITVPNNNGSGATSCNLTSTMSRNLLVNPLPTTYTVTGGGTYCTGNAGIAVGLSGSQVGVTYQLQLGGVNTGSAVTGTGSAISFGNQVAAGVYTVVATQPATLCSRGMAGNAIIIVNPLPTTSLIYHR